MRYSIPARFPKRIPLGGMVRNQRTGKFRIWPLVVFALFFTFYYLSNQKEVPLTGRTQLVDITREQEAALGLQSFQQVLSQASLVNGGSGFELVQSVAARLVPAVTEANFDWDFRLVESDQANAFALPGGKVVVYTGILPIVSNESGLAVVLGHEMAHAVARHGAERLSQQKLAQWGSMAVSMSVGEMEPSTQRLVLGAFGVGTRFGVLLPFSREHESEADFMGLIFLARACFDPEEAPKVWERMSKKAGSTPLEFLSTHPSPSTRIQQFQEWMPQAKQIYRESCS